VDAKRRLGVHILSSFLRSGKPPTTPARTRSLKSARSPGSQSKEALEVAMSDNAVAKLQDVFGVSRDVPLTYVERDDVDKKFVSSLAREKHIVVYGGSKQGKTSLRKHALPESDYVVVQCTGTTSRLDVYSMILKAAGARIDTLEKRSAVAHAKAGITVSLKAKLPFIGEGEVKGGGDAGRKQSGEVESRYIEIDPEDPNDVIRILAAMGFSKFIVVEDYHYLPIEVQREIAVDLKVFHEKSKICFIVVGVWVEQNRLSLYNGDLSGRVSPIDADEWTGADLHRVIRAGEGLLNVIFLDDVRSGLISASQGNVGVLQELCFLMCERCDVHETQRERRHIGSVEMLDEITRAFAREQTGRYNNFIRDFAQGFKRSENALYQWIVACVITSRVEDLRSGIRPSDILSKIKKTHDRKNKLQIANVVQALKNTARLQQQCRIQPIVLDYNENDAILRVVDSGFILFLSKTRTEDVLNVINMKLQDSSSSETAGACN
jgi:hypothetical protein